MEFYVDKCCQELKKKSSLSDEELDELVYQVKEGVGGGSDGGAVTKAGEDIEGGVVGRGTFELFTIRFLTVSKVNVANMPIALSVTVRFLTNIST